MPQWFLRFSEFPEFSEFNESSAPFRENSIEQQFRFWNKEFFFILFFNTYFLGHEITINPNDGNPLLISTILETTKSKTNIVLPIASIFSVSTARKRAFLPM